MRTNIVIEVNGVRYVPTNDVYAILTNDRRLDIYAKGNAIELDVVKEKDNCD